MNGLFPYATVAHVVSSVGFVLTTWLGAYLAAHVPRSFPARLATLSLFALSGYFLHTVLCIFIPAEEIGHLWRRYMGWFALLPLPLWLHLTSTLLPKERRAWQRIVVWLTYLTCGFLSAAWVFGAWMFSRNTLLPPELAGPISLFAAGVGGLALLNIREARRRAADRTLQMRYTLLGGVVLILAGGILYWLVIVDWLGIPWTPVTRIAIGDSIPLTASVVLAYAVAYHNAFMAGRWVKRDFYFHAATVGAIAGLYFLTVVGARELALAFGFDSATLTLIAVVGLTLLTHLLAERSRGLWDNLFFRQLRALPGDMSNLILDAGAPRGRLESQMTALVNRLVELTGASMVCVALREKDQYIIRASTEPERVGRAIPLAASPDGPKPVLGPETGDHAAGPNGLRWDCLVLAEPILVNGQTAGHLLLGERGLGEGYDRQERVWVSALAAYLGMALEQAWRREETERMLTALSAEAEDLAAQELSLQREFEAMLAGPPPRISLQELREAIYACNRPERLAAILARDDSTLAALPYIVRSGLPPGQALRQRLTQALESIALPDVLPSLESLRDRAVRDKRRRHLPASAANYHTLRLVMAGYTHEAIAEMLEVSPRQVRNYLDRAVNSVKAFLEREAEVRDVQIAAKMP